MKRGVSVVLVTISLDLLCVSEVLQDEVHKTLDDGKLMQFSTIAESSLNSEFYSAVKRYQCCWYCSDDAELMLYGTKAWEFARQDVTLEFTYPSEDAVEINDKYKDYVITGFQIKLYQGGTGSRCRGYLDSGGLGQREITIIFVCGGLNSLAYQFWIYGRPHSEVFGNDTKHPNMLC